ncbi:MULTISPECIES: hypothetical protein [Brucellaceae]|uniref:hypothetical protein n=1 Tax=Brucellaceae TaxID=118882 RepID=UPI0003B456E6|nr:MULTISPECIES: hypothetical protein [Brucellaceae]MBX8827255.1 hypothetical protein [Ochrobactrum sp. SFR4]
MNGAIEWTQISSLLVIGGSVVGVWYRLQQQINANRAYHERQHAAYQLHVAENYVTRPGMNEQTERMMRAIDGLDAKIDRMNDRLDKVFQTR